MIIANLEHFEDINTVNEIKGGFAFSDIQFKVLGLGTFLSSSLGSVETLAVSSPGVSISGLQGGFTAIAA
jgi:hypothetical protein